jgi:tetratricopeptide (TPR) repeat protein
MLHLGALAQKHIYEDLLVLYVDEKYDKCIFKAEGYTTNDKTKRDALPFLYISMCYHEMSKQEKYLADNPKASRDALKWAEKYRRKDKDLEFFHNYEDYWMSLNTQAMEMAGHHMDMGEHSKARRIYARMVGYMPENPGAWQMLALSQIHMRMHREAAETMKRFDEAYQAVPDLERLPADQRKLLKDGLLRYADHEGRERLTGRGPVPWCAGTVAIEILFKNNTAVLQENECL